MPAAFPFPGRRLEICSFEGVRYRGVLSKVDSSSKSITLVKVHHYGTEDRHGPDQLPKPAKGALPEAEERVFYNEWISRLKVIKAGDELAVARKRPAAGEEPSTSKSARLEGNNTSGEITNCLRSQLGSHPEGEVVSPEPRRQSTDPYPLYFVSQLLQTQKALAVLMNAEQRPDDPAYIRLHIDSLPTRPVPTQIWEVHAYKWIKDNRHVVPHQYRTGRDEDAKEFAEKLGGVPWMRDDFIVPQAQATYARLKSKVERKRERLGRVKSIRLKMEKPHQVEVEVGDEGAISGYLLDRTHFVGTNEQFEKLEEGEAIEVELVRLPEGCRVGPKYVLPNIVYHPDKAPFEPQEDSGDLTIAQRGDYLPWKFKRQRGGEGNRPRSQLENLSPGEVQTVETPEPRRPSTDPCPLYFISQIWDIKALGVLLNANECPHDPVYIRLHIHNSLRVLPIPTQVWRVSRYSWIESHRHLLPHHYRSGRELGVSEFMALRGGMAWMHDHHIVPQANAHSAELVHDVEAITERKGIVHARVGKKHNYVEVTARGAVHGCLLGATQFYGTENDFKRLEEGEAIEVELIRLTEGCRVGPKYVLPNIDYHPDKAPFEPQEDGGSLTIAHRGDYLPWKFKKLHSHRPRTERTITPDDFPSTSSRSHRREDDPGDTPTEEGRQRHLSEGEVVSPEGQREQEQSTHPLYFISQLKDSSALAVLVNESECPRDPVYLRLLVNSLSTSPSPTQVWRVRGYTWVEEKEGKPWMLDQTIVAQAEALTAELVHDVEARTERRGKVRARVGRGSSYVEVAAKGVVDGCLLGATQYDGDKSDFSRLRAGDEVRVEMIRLPEGCWVGEKYVLPRIDYHRHRAPFEPDVRGERLVKSRKGDYLPWRIKLTRSNH